MYERFTDRSRKVMRLAGEVAKDRKAAEIDVPHILYGLLAERSGVGANALRDAGLSVQAVGDSLPEGDGRAPTTAIQLSSAARDVIELARCLSGQRDKDRHFYVGTEDLAVAVERVGGLTNWPVMVGEIERRVSEYLGTPTVSTVTVIKPEPSRHVHYYPAGVNDFDMAMYSDQPLVAIVTYVHDGHNDRLVNLAVFDAEGRHFARTSVPLVQPDDELPTVAHCRWMPYTVEQARRKAD